MGKFIERVAIEFNQLQYMLTKGRNLPFVKSILPRIDRIADTLKGSLELTFRTGIETSKMSVLTQCLRTYALIDRTEDAEAVYRSALVGPFMRKTLIRDAVEPSSSVPASQIAEQGAIQLSQVLEKVLLFVDQDCEPVLRIASKELRGTSYDILTNCIWKEFSSVVMQNLSFIFAPGIPDAFHKNYSVMVRFLAAFEGKYSNRKLWLRLRESQSYQDFMKKWQLSIYFQIRFKEIAVSFEDSLPVSAELANDGVNLGQPWSFSKQLLLLPSSKSLLECICRCWHPDVFIFSLSHRFWKVTIQLISRYALWTRSILPDMASRDGEDGPDEDEQHVHGRRGSDVGTSVSDLAVKEYGLAFLTQLYHDILQLEIKIPETFKAQIAPNFSNYGREAVLGGMEESLNEQVKSASIILPGIASKIITMISRRCIKSLKQVQGIIGQFRLTNRGAPTEPSAFLGTLFQPLVIFMEGVGGLLPKDVADHWGFKVVEAVTKKYLQATTKVLETVKSTEDSLKRLKKTKRSVSGVQNADGTGGKEALSDEDKIRLQFSLDVARYEAEVKRLGIDAGQLGHLRELRSTVEGSGRPGDA